MGHFFVENQRFQVHLDHHSEYSCFICLLSMYGQLLTIDIFLLTVSVSQMSKADLEILGDVR